MRVLVVVEDREMKIGWNESAASCFEVLEVVDTLDFSFLRPGPHGLQKERARTGLNPDLPSSTSIPTV